MPHVRGGDSRTEGLAARVRDQAPLLETASRDHARRERLEEDHLVIAAPKPDLGDVVVALLASTLAGLRDRLISDGFSDAASVVADLVEIVDDYLTRPSR